MAMVHGIPMTTRNVLVTLISAGKAFRATPIVDDDFATNRDFFDKTLGEAEAFVRKTRPAPPFSDEVITELSSARLKYPDTQHSLHEGYAVMLEEVEEVWEIVKQKASKRDHQKLREELVQVAAMAQRMAEDANL